MVRIFPAFHNGATARWQWLTFVSSARIPQIIKNYRQKSCEGLALLFFLLSLSGNSAYGASLVAYSQDKAYLIRALPWLLGSLGTVIEDSIIFVQFRLYRHKKEPKVATNGSSAYGTTTE